MSSLAIKIDEVMNLASLAFTEYRKLSGAIKAKFIKQITDEIEQIGDELIHTVMEETALPEARVRGERGRTVNQLLQFAEMIEEGSWVNAIIEEGNPDREPLPKPDLRRMLIPMGPVVVFGAGNFPLAFSVAGGDTASALAGGNPVVVKGHPAHPKTGKLVADAIHRAVEKCNLPQGTFSYIEDSSYDAGQLLVKHSQTKAVAFTGSEKGGRALFDIANQRKEPIPVFAEMGSINPVVVLPKAQEKKYKEISKNLVASVNMGAGQFCTNPGLIITQKEGTLDLFLQALGEEVMAASPTTMYSEGILKNYQTGLSSLLAQDGIATLNLEKVDISGEKAVPVLGTVEARHFISNPEMHKEIFGPFSLVVVCDSADQMEEIAKVLKGQLTCTVHALEEEMEDFKVVIDELMMRCGRILFNGVPTGVEVCAAMQHGGPYPASTDVRFTSVGTEAIKRFVRPVSFQDWPDSLLPLELQRENMLGIWRKVNGRLTKD